MLTFLRVRTAGEGNTCFEWNAGTLNLDMTLTGRIPATDRQVTGQVLVSYSLTFYGHHLGLWQMNTKAEKFYI